MTFPELTVQQRETLRTYASSVALVPLAAYFATGIEGYDALGLPGLFMHSLNLLPHEAGHFIFRFFGTFLEIAGGSLLQLILPALIAHSCFRHGQKLGTQLSLLWLGQSWVDVAVYAADAQRRALPLLGGLGPESHDWYNLLAMSGMLSYTPVIAGFIYLCAFPCWILMALIPKWLW